MLYLLYIPCILEICFLTFPSHPLQCNETLNTTTWSWERVEEELYWSAAAENPASCYITDTKSFECQKNVFVCLSRMRTDYIDLYQIHWPDRYVPMFGETEYDPTRQFCSIPIEEQLDVLGRAVDAGKIRYIGLSNETPYGVMKFLQLAKGVVGRPKIVSVQNSFNLLCRNFNSGLAECCHHERISLLAYSPLAMGILSGKYFSSDGGPADARMNLFRGKYSEGESRYSLTNPIIKAATKKYLYIAEKYALHPVSLAIAFVLKHPLVASAVFGATKPWQLRDVLKAFEVELGPEIISEIDEVHAQHPNPCP